MLGDPDRAHVELPQLPWPLDAEEARPLAALQRAAALDQLQPPHHPQHALAVDGDPRAGGGRRRSADHPTAVGLVGERLGNDLLLDDLRLDAAAAPSAASALDRAPGGLIPATRATTDRSPHSSASTISIFCVTVQLPCLHCSLNLVSLPVERSMLSPPPDSLFEAPPLRDRPAIQVSYLSTPNRGAEHKWGSGAPSYEHLGLGCRPEHDIIVKRRKIVSAHEVA